MECPGLVVGRDQLDDAVVTGCGNQPLQPLEEAADGRGPVPPPTLGRDPMTFMASTTRRVKASIYIVRTMATLITGLTDEDITTTLLRSDSTIRLQGDEGDTGDDTADETDATDEADPSDAGDAADQGDPSDQGDSTDQ